MSRGSNGEQSNSSLSNNTVPTETAALLLRWLLDSHALHQGDGVPLEHNAAQLLALVALHVHLEAKGAARSTKFSSISR